MGNYKDITEPVLSHSNLQAVTDKFSEKARRYSIVRDASLQIETVEGARTGYDQFLFQMRGELIVYPIGLPNLGIKFSGAGEYKREERRVYLTNFKVLNDITGIANKLIEATGIGIGRSLHVNEHDDELIQTLLPNA